MKRCRKEEKFEQRLRRTKPTSSKGGIITFSCTGDFEETQSEDSEGVSGGYKNERTQQARPYATSEVRTVHEPLQPGTFKIDGSRRELTRNSFKEKKVLVCELYKQGMDEFKKAEAINVMDVPIENRKEVADCKEKMKGYHRSAQERFIILMNKIKGTTRPTHATSLPGTSSARVASPGRRGARLNSAPALM
ncbi:hypothetical protein COOONC_03188 [Cooperia oncophora]